MAYSSFPESKVFFMTKKTRLFSPRLIDDNMLKRNGVQKTINGCGISRQVVDEMQSSAFEHISLE